MSGIKNSRIVMLYKQPELIKKLRFKQRVEIAHRSIVALNKLHESGRVSTQVDLNHIAIRIDSDTGKIEKAYITGAKNNQLSIGETYPALKPGSCVSSMFDNCGLARYLSKLFFDVDLITITKEDLNKKGSDNEGMVRKVITKLILPDTSYSAVDALGEIEKLLANLDIARLQCAFVMNPQKLTPIQREAVLESCR